MAAAAQAATTPPTLKLYSAGDDQALWLVVGQWNAQDKAYYHSFAMMDKSSTQLRVMSRITPQKGTVGQLAVVGGELHVFYARDAHFNDDGAHYRYDRTGGDRLLSLPGPVMPLAVAGESSDRPRLWAVVSEATAAAVRTVWNERRQGTSRPANASEPAEAEQIAEASQPAAKLSLAAASAGYQLVRYEGVSWQPGLAAPSQCESGERFWLAVGPSRYHLFWQNAAGDQVVHYAWYEKDHWIIGANLPLDDPPARAFAEVINTRLIFAVMSGNPPEQSMPRLSLWAWEPGGQETAVETQGVWSRLPDLQSGAGDALSLSPEAALGGFLDKLVVLRAREGRAEFALYPSLTGGPPDRPFEDVPLAGSGITRTQRNLRDLVATLVVAAVLLLVFWRRQESIATPVALPAGIAVAGAGKRAAAALVDMVPAAIVANAIWFDAIRQFVRESQAAFSSGLDEQGQTPDAIYWAWGCFITVYVLWGVVFEVLWRTTPGKRLMRCEVRTEACDSPNVVQIVIRNITKAIELIPYLQIWPFMLVVFFTRNHQRVGDLLAHTIVVEHQNVVAGGDYDDSQKTD